MQRAFGWYWFTSGKENELTSDKCGKWMHFFSDQDFAIKICQKAIDEDVCVECKCSDLEMNLKYKMDKTGVICFYLNGDNIDSHKKVLRFMIDNDLVRRTKSGRLYNISFKFDSQTVKGEYGADYEGNIKLSQFLNLDTSEWIYK